MILKRSRFLELDKTTARVDTTKLTISFGKLPSNTFSSINSPSKLHEIGSSRPFVLHIEQESILISNVNHHFNKRPGMPNGSTSDEFSSSKSTQIHLVNQLRHQYPFQQASIFSIFMFLRSCYEFTTDHKLPDCNYAINTRVITRFLVNMFNRISLPIQICILSRYCNIIPH